jgi:hypothetical protein
MLAHTGALEMPLGLDGKIKDRGAGSMFSDLGEGRPLLGFRELMLDELM